MGVNLKRADLVKRTGLMSFFGVGASVSHTFTRMEGFTEISTSKNAKEYERQYVDEDFTRTDVTGYNASKSYAFDRHKGNTVHDDIIKITEDELTGQDAVREIVTVDMTTVTKSTDATTRYYATAYRRQYAIIPDTNGDSTDCLTYSGTFKTRGELEKITVSTYDVNWSSCYAGIDTDIPVLTTLTVSGATFVEPSLFSSTTYYYQLTSTAAKATLTPTYASDVTATYMVNGVSATSLSNIALSTGTNSVVIMLAKGSATNTYSLTITKTS